MAQRFIGVMTGSSADGADAVAIDFAKPLLPALAPYSCPMPVELRRDILALQKAGDSDELARAASCTQRLAGLCAQASIGAADQAGWQPAEITAIGLHGQTVRHAPAAGYSIQLANGARLATLTGIDVVCDFRAHDMALKGQGAPLAQAFHQLLFACNKPRAVINIGGMANVSVLQPDQRATLAYDLGPGCALLDDMASRYLDRPYDASGAWAAAGRPQNSLLAALRSHPYFARPPPKSCGRDEFDLQWVTSQAANIELIDIQATLLELCAATIADAIHEHAANGDAILCGGGCANQALSARIVELAKPIQVHNCTELGCEPAWVEPAAFAYFAKLRLANKALPIRQATGAAADAIAGAWYRAASRAYSG